ncbi:hypothetical protein INR49_023708 [Caranx melampygus]|nr:hypothetical protein INR49_023708 [Caranx melampygus]
MEQSSLWFKQRKGGGFKMQGGGQKFFSSRAIITLQQGGEPEPHSRVMSLAMVSEFFSSRAIITLQQGGEPEPHSRVMSWAMVSDLHSLELGLGDAAETDELHTSTTEGFVSMYFGHRFGAQVIHDLRFALDLLLSLG